MPVKLLEKVVACRKALGHSDEHELVCLTLRDIEDELRKAPPADQGEEKLRQMLVDAHSVLQAVKHDLDKKSGYVSAATRTAISNVVIAGKLHAALRLESDNLD